jgi:hypothetical protein
MILAKMIVHFSSRFSVQFSLVRLFTFDISLVLILFSFFNCGSIVVVCFFVSVCFARFVSVDSSRAVAFLRVVVEHSRSAEDETKCCRSSQDVSGNPPILCTNKAITSISAQAPGPPLSSRQHPVSPFSVSGPFSISVFRSRKFRRSFTVLQLLGRDEGPVSSKENLASS